MIMQSQKLNKLIAIFFVLFFFSACTKDLVVPDPPAVPIKPAPGQISYAGAIQPIFTAKCVSCHGAGQNAPVLAAGSSYMSLKTINGMIDTDVPANSNLYKKMFTGGSMASHCTVADADSVLRWITEGANNN